MSVETMSLPSSEQIGAHLLPPGVKTVNLLKILPPRQFADVPLKSVHGHVAWVNWNLLEEMDPAWASYRRHLPEQLEKEILQRYCKIAVENPEKGDTLGHADRYRGFFGDDMGGSGRACTLDSGENLKGLGRSTPVAPPSFDGSHSDGCIGMEEAVIEAVAGEALAHLLEQPTRSTRVLAIIAAETEWGVPDREAQPMLIVRVGAHVRPSHFTSGMGLRFSGIDSKKLKRSSQKLFEAGHAALHSEAVVRQQAQSAAALRRWRIEHGSINESNLVLDGGLLDYGTFTAQPHTAPVYTLKSENVRLVVDTDPDMANSCFYGAEHKMFASVFSALRGMKDQTQLSENAARWKKIYKQEDNVQTLSSLGWPSDMVAELLIQEPDNAAKLAKHIRLLGRLFYENHSADSRTKWKEATQASLMDKHRLLADLPRLFFDANSGEPLAVTKDQLAQALPLLPQSPSARAEPWRKSLGLQKYAVKNRAEGMKRIDASLETICALYPELLLRAAKRGVQSRRWDSIADCLDNVAARARLENMPLQSLYAPNLRNPVKRAIISYNVKHAQNPMRTEGETTEAKKSLFAEIADLIDGAISGSKRRVDALLFDTPVEPGPTEASHILQRQQIGGITYYLEAHRSGERFLCIEIPGAVARRTGADEVDNGHAHTIRQPVKPYECATFEGPWVVEGKELDLKDPVRQYTYAVPGRHELEKIVAAHVAGSDAAVASS